MQKIAVYRGITQTLLLQAFSDLADGLKGIWLGRLKHTKDKYENKSWTNDTVKSLRVYFEYNKSQCNKLNCEKQIYKCKAIIKKTETRETSH